MCLCQSHTNRHFVISYTNEAHVAKNVCMGQLFNPMCELFIMYSRFALHQSQMERQTPQRSYVSKMTLRTCYTLAHIAIALFITLL